MKPVTAVIITFNEESNIRQCLATLPFASECIVVDSASTDRTTSIAETMGARVFPVAWKGYARSKNAGIDAASNDWILLVDADERVSPALAASIQERLGRPSQPSGYMIARRTWYLDRWIRGSGWYPDFTIRLLDRTKGRVRDVLVHESVEVEGPIERLDGDLLHYSYRDLSDHIRRIDKYTTLAAQQWNDEHRHISIVAMFFRPIWEFVRKLIIKRGFIDGLPGWIIAGMHAWYVFLKYAKTYELTHRTPLPENQSESDAS